MLLKCCTHYASKFGHRTRKSLFSFQYQRMLKLLCKCTHFHILARLCSNSFKLGPKLPDVQAGYRKGRGTRNQIANIYWIIEKAREFQKTSTLASLTALRSLTMWITTNCGKFLERWEYQTILPASYETCIQDKKQ